MTLAEWLGMQDTPTLAVLQRGLEDATGYQRQVGGVHDPGVTFKEFREALTSMEGALRKIAMGRHTAAAARQLKLAIGPEPRSRFPQDQRLARGQVPYEALREVDAYNLDPIGRFHANATAAHQTADAGAARAALDAAMAFHAAIKSPGRGRARSQARRYIMGIQKLAEHFHEALPQHRISADENSVFREYVRYWLREHVGLDLNSPDRHIANALEDLQHWRDL